MDSSLLQVGDIRVLGSQRFLNMAMSLSFSAAERMARRTICCPSMWRFLEQSLIIILCLISSSARLREVNRPLTLHRK